MSFRVSARHFGSAAWLEFVREEDAIKCAEAINKAEGICSIEVYEEIDNRQIKSWITGEPKIRTI